MPTMTALALFAVATTKCPIKQKTLPPTRNHLRPRRSVLAPLEHSQTKAAAIRRTTNQIMKQTVIERVHAGMNQTTLEGSPKLVAI